MVSKIAVTLDRKTVAGADLNPVRGRKQAGSRLVLILSQGMFNKRSETVVAMAITSRPHRAGFPLATWRRAAGLLELIG